MDLNQESDERQEVPDAEKTETASGGNEDDGELSMGSNEDDKATWPIKTRSSSSVSEADFKESKQKMHASKLNNEMKALKKQNEKYKQDIIELNIKTASLSVENGRLRGEAEKSKEEHTIQINNMTETIEKQRADFSTLRDKVTALKQERKKRLAYLKELEETNSELKVELAAAQDDELVSEQLEKANRDLNKMKAEHSALSKQMENLKYEKTKLLDTTNKLKDTVSDLESKLSSSHKLAEDLSNRSRSKSEEVKQLKQKTMQQSEKIDELEKVRDKLKSDITEVNAMCDDELSNFKQLLKEKENENRELLEQLDTSSNSHEADSSIVQRAKGVIVHDSATAGIANNIDGGIDWELVSAPLDGTSEAIQEHQLEKADIALFVIGTAAIKKEKKASEVFKRVKPVVSMAMSLKCKVIVCEAPPTIKQGAAGQISFLNFKLSKLPGVQFVASNLQTSKLEILDNNDTLTSNAKHRIAHIINSNISPPEKLKSQYPASKVATRTDDEDIIELVQLQPEQIGKVIGKGGETIIGMSKRLEVTMRVGKWYERKKDKKDDYEEKMNGVAIFGKSGNVTAACEAVKAILADSDNK